VQNAVTRRDHAFSIGGRGAAVGHRGRIGRRALPLAAVAAAALVACSPGSEPAGGVTPTPVPSPAPTSAPPTPAPPGSAAGNRYGVDDQVLAAFLDGCGATLAGSSSGPTWREGRLDYPTALDVDVHFPATYVATVTIRPDAAAQPAPRAIPGTAGRSDVYLQCVVAARLTTEGDFLEVEDDDWQPRTFTPAGVLDWSWSITGKELGHQDVRLELQPAVQIDDGEPRIADSPLDAASFVTRVRVTGNWVEEVGKWWEENWAGLTAIVGALGAGGVAVLKWGGDARDALRSVRRRDRPRDEAPAAGSGGDPPGPGSG
jgi:hypothetical protein